MEIYLLFIYYFLFTDSHKNAIQYTSYKIQDTRYYLYLANSVYRRVTKNATTLQVPYQQLQGDVHLQLKLDSLSFLIDIYIPVYISCEKYSLYILLKMDW